MEPTPSEGHARTAEAGVVRGCRVETDSPRSLLRLVDRPQFAWAGTTTVAAGGAAATVSADGPGRFEGVREQGQALLDRLDTPDPLPEGAEPRLYGGFAFADAHDSGTGEPWTGYPGAWFVLPEVQLSLTGDGAWLTAVAVGSSAGERAGDRLDRWKDRLGSAPAVARTPPPGVSGLSYDPSRELWREQVEATVDRIEGGTLEKVVLAQSLTAQLEEPAVPPDILSRLGDSYPDCYRFLFAPDGGGSFFGATPEQLVSVDGDIVETEALAGSIDRGDTAAADERLAARLRASEKDRHEHDLVVETIRDQLAGLADSVSTGERTVRRLATVQHLRTPIRARLSEETHVLELVEGLHPTPAVGGLPPAAALAASRETETFDRGWYAAPVGWFDGEGNGTFAVAIRSGVATGRSVTTFAGAGIVADSDPDREWAELQLKYRPVLDELS